MMRTRVLCAAFASVFALAVFDAPPLCAAQPKRSVVRDQRVRQQREARDAERAERRELQERLDDRIRERELEHPERNNEDEQDEDR
jgi:hypothetical protein